MSVCGAHLTTAVHSAHSVDQFHRGLMVTTWTLTMIAFIVIFVELKGWTSIPVTQNPHAVIGCITTALAFIQPIMAYFRPHPGTPKRFIFNWAHWLVGNSAHILGSTLSIEYSITALSLVCQCTCFQWMPFI